MMEVNIVVVIDGETQPPLNFTAPGESVLTRAQANESIMANLSSVLPEMLKIEPPREGYMRLSEGELKAIYGHKEAEVDMSGDNWGAEIAAGQLRPGAAADYVNLRGGLGGDPNCAGDVACEDLEWAAQRPAQEKEFRQRQLPQYIAVLRQAAAIRADEGLMTELREYVREQRNELALFLDDIGGK